MISEERLPYEQQTRPDGLCEDDSSDSSSEGSENGQHMTELQMHLSTIRYILSHMNKLSFMIRNPALRPVSLKATLYRETVRIDGEEKSLVEPVSFDQEARRNICEWLKLIESTENTCLPVDSRSSHTGKTFSSIVQAAIEDPNVGQNIDVDIFDEYAKFDHLHMVELFRNFGIMLSPDQAPKNRTLFERLTQAITDRRRQFRYWSRHADKLAAGSSAIAVRLKGPQHSTEAKSRMEGSVAAGNTFAKETAPPPTLYQDTEVTFTYDKKLDDMLESQSVVSYASTAWDLQGRGVELPPPPRAAAAGNDFVRNLTSRSLIAPALTYLYQGMPLLFSVVPSKAWQGSVLEVS